MGILRHPRSGAGILVICAGIALASALRSPMLGHAAWGGAAATVAIAVAGLRVRRSAHLLAGQALALAAATTLLTISGAGLDLVPGAPAGRSLLALLAYPFLGVTVVGAVAAHRRVRVADLVVEAALIGTAGAIFSRIAIGAGQGELGASAWHLAHSAFPAVLVGFDLALIVVATRGLRSPAARRGSLGCILIGLVCLLGAHVWQEVAASHGVVATGVAGTLALIGLAAVGVGASLPEARVEPNRLLENPQLFSAAHAGVVTVSVLVAPIVLAVQAARGSSASATAATGATLSGLILAGHIVGLLRERAATEHQATHDGLTGLPNRALVVDRFDRSIAHARRESGHCAVLFMDLDRFKEVNDTYGHAAGDDLLRTVAARLEGCVRDEDTVARLSGDEFVILLPHLAAAPDVVTVAQRMVEALGHPITVAEDRMLVAGSIGVAVYPDDGATANELLASADAAMHRAKEALGSSFELFSAEMATQALARLHVEAGLLDGLGRDEFVLHYQPILDVASARTVGAEALVRWNHPDQGFLLPGHFIPIAEQSDLIVMLGEKVMFDACRELRRWQDLGLREQFISVNVSSRQFSHGLVSTVTAALRETGANPHNLVVELTESTVVDNIGHVASALAELAEMGVRSAIDDFGTGYCGLRYLGELPVASLKIDRSFIQGMTPSAAAIVAATIAMGHSLGLTLIAEGVETVEQRRFLTEHGCDRIQGYLIGKPMPADDLVALLQVARLEGAVAELATEGVLIDATVA